MSNGAMLQKPSANTSSEATDFAHPSWATPSTEIGRDPGMLTAALRAFSGNRHYLDVAAIAFGASLLPCARDDLSAQNGLRLIPSHTETPARVPVPVSRPTSVESPFAGIQRLVADLHQGLFPTFSEASLKRARIALEHLDARANEDVDTWARRIAGELSTRTD